MFDILPQEIFQEICFLLDVESVLKFRITKCTRDKINSIISNPLFFRIICPHITWKCIDDMWRDVKFFSSKKFKKTQIAVIDHEPENAMLYYFPKTKLYGFSKNDDMQVSTFKNGSFTFESTKQNSLNGSILLNNTRAKFVHDWKSQQYSQFCLETGDLVMINQRLQIECEVFQYAFCTNTLTIAHTRHGYDNHSLFAFDPRNAHPVHIPLIDPTYCFKFFKKDYGVDCVTTNSLFTKILIIHVANDLSVIQRSLDILANTKFQDNFCWIKPPTINSNGIWCIPEFRSQRTINTKRKRSTYELIMSTKTTYHGKYNTLSLREKPIISTQSSGFIVIKRSGGPYLFVSENGIIKKPNISKAFIKKGFNLGNQSEEFPNPIIETGVITENQMLYTPDGIFRFTEQLQKVNTNTYQRSGSSVLFHYKPLQ